MAVATDQPQDNRHAGSAGPSEPADALVVFGITGDLAKVMTFRSLYRLERVGRASGGTRRFRYPRERHGTDR